MNIKVSAPMQSQTNNMITEFGPHDLRLRSSPRGDLHYHNRVFYVHPNNVYTSQYNHYAITPHTLSVGPSPCPPPQVLGYNLSLGTSTDATHLGFDPVSHHTLLSVYKCITSESSQLGTI